MKKFFKLKGCFSKRTCVFNGIVGIWKLWIQDSRSRKNFLNPASLDSKFKIQDPERTSWIQPPWIQDSRIKIQDLGKTSWIQRPLNPKRLDSRSFFGSWILNLESWDLNRNKIARNCNSEPLKHPKNFDPKNATKNNGSRSPGGVPYIYIYMYIYKIYHSTARPSIIPEVPNAAEYL